MCAYGLKLDRSERPVLICPKECFWRGANSQWLQLLVEERGREGEWLLLFYLGDPHAPLCLMLTGHLSKCCDATAMSRPHHVAQLRSNHYVARTSFGFITRLHQQVERARSMQFTIEKYHKCWRYAQESTLTNSGCTLYVCVYFSGLKWPCWTHCVVQVQKNTSSTKF